LDEAGAGLFAEAEDAMVRAATLDINAGTDDGQGWAGKVAKDEFVSFAT
jgi:hypothetical protein